MNDKSKHINNSNKKTHLSNNQICIFPLETDCWSEKASQYGSSYISEIATWLPETNDCSSASFAKPISEDGIGAWPTNWLHNTINWEKEGKEYYVSPVINSTNRDY